MNKKLINRYKHFIYWSGIHPEICNPHIKAIEKYAKENNINLPKYEQKKI